MLTSSLLLAIFLGSLISGWHCALMCGGIAAAIEHPVVSEAPLRSKSELFRLQLVMHLGRITTYVLLGAIAASVGVVVWQQNLIPIQRPLFALTSLMLILMGIRLYRAGKSESLPGGKWLSAKIATYWAKYLGSAASCLLYTSDAADD